MKVKKCAYFSKISLMGIPCESCNLFYNGVRFVSCESIAIAKCPYKMFIKGMITKEQLNEKINNLFERIKK